MRDFFANVPDEFDQRRAQRVILGIGTDIRTRCDKLRGNAKRRTRLLPLDPHFGFIDTEHRLQSAELRFDERGELRRGLMMGVSQSQFHVQGCFSGFLISENTYSETNPSKK